MIGQISSKLLVQNMLYSHQSITMGFATGHQHNHGIGIVLIPVIIDDNFLIDRLHKGPHQDNVGMIVKAVRKAGLRMGLYHRYSILFHRISDLIL
jgi:hypothetical protein